MRIPLTVKSIGLSLVMCTLSIGARAQYDHVHLGLNESLSYAEVFERAIENTPEILEKEVRYQQARDYARNGSNLLSGRPSLQLNYYDDGVLENNGMKELEYGIQLPLWRPGERRQAQALGRSYQSQAEAWEDYLQLFVTGRVRTVLMDLREAGLLLDLETQATANTEELVRVSTLLYEAGEIAELDLMRSQSLLLEQRRDELRAQERLVDAEREYNVLTGLTFRPVLAYEENLVETEEITADHPELRFLQSGVALAEAAVGQSALNARGSPTLSVGTRSEKGSRFQDSIDSLGISLTIPFGGQSYVDSRTSSARRDLVDAQVLVRNTWRRLNRDLHEVEHGLYINGESLPLAREEAELGERRWEMALTAFEQGELNLSEVVIALRQSLEGMQSLQELELERERLIIEYNQISGVLP